MPASRVRVANRFLQGRRGIGSNCRTDEPFISSLSFSVWHTKILNTPKVIIVSLTMIRKIDQGSPMFKLGMKIETREHGLPLKYTRKLVRDHLRENPRYYRKS